MLLLLRLLLVLRPLVWKVGARVDEHCCRLLVDLLNCTMRLLSSTNTSNLLVKFLGRHVLSPGSLTNLGGSGRVQMLRVEDGSLDPVPPGA